MVSKETDKLFNEEVSLKDDCNLCKESNLKIGSDTGYGVIIYRIGNSKNGWFATLSPKTGGNPKSDFTIQLTPISHLTHFSQIASHPELEENYGISFSRLCRAMTIILMQGGDLKATAEEKKLSVSIGTYGKTTTWKEKKEHLHLKIFPFRNNIGQPYTVDSSFERKETFKDNAGKEFVKMDPIKKLPIEKSRFNNLAKDLISLLNEK